jgi:hypothetical protein
MINVLGMGAVLLALQVSTAPAPIKGARITLAPKAMAGLKVTLENRRNSPLVQCTIALRARGQAAPNQFFTFHFQAESPSAVGDSTPVPPQARRVLDLTLHNQIELETAVLQLAVFEDGFAEGAPRELGEWRQARQARLDDLTYWVRAFDAMPRIAETEVRAFLADRIVERRRAAAADPSAVRTRLQRALEEYPLGPDVWLPLDRLRADARRELAAATAQPPAAAGADATGAITDVGLAWEPATPTEFVARIENLRDVPIEAFGFELVDRIYFSRLRSARRADFCGTSREPAPPGSGRIQPKEVRDLFLGKPPGDMVLRLTFVLFDDQVFEGSPEVREQLLQERRRTGHCQQR